MDYDKIINNIEKKIFHPVYLLTGEEPYFIDQISSKIENEVLTADEKDLNLSIVYGRDLKVVDLLSMAQRFPMMSNYQVVIVREAQQLDKLELMENYFTKPLKSTILVLNVKHKTPDKRRTWVKRLEETGVWFESKKLKDPQIPIWITEYLKKHNLIVDARIAQLITDNIGNDLSRIANELDKLCINLKEGCVITPDDIEKHIGISKEYNLFELQNALGSGNKAKAIKIMWYFAENDKEYPIAKLIPMLAGYYFKLLIFHRSANKSNNFALAAELELPPFVVKEYQNAARYISLEKTCRAISLLREFDMKGKGLDNASVDGGELKKELIFKLIA